MKSQMRPLSNEQKKVKIKRYFKNIIHTNEKSFNINIYD